MAIIDNWDSYTRQGLDMASSAVALGFTAAKAGTRLGVSTVALMDAPYDLISASAVFSNARYCVYCNQSHLFCRRPYSVWW